MVKIAKFKDITHFWAIKKIIKTPSNNELRFYANNLPMDKHCLSYGCYTNSKNYRRIAVIIAVDVFINNGEFERYKADFDIAREMLQRASPKIPKEKIPNMLCDIHHNVRQYLKILGITVEIPKREL